MPYKDLEARRANSRAYYTTHKEERLAYVKAHREELNAYSQVWQKEHRESRIASCRAYEVGHREEKRAYAEAHREDRRAYQRVYRAIHLEEIHIYQETHREESCARARAWAKTNPQAVAERNRRRRALKRGVTIGPIDLAAIRKRDQMQCCICGKKVNEKDFSLDHSQPLSLGGAHCQENLRVAHLRCNSRRQAGRLPVQMVLC